jgi:hypothetical protein
MKNAKVNQLITEIKKGNHTVKNIAQAIKEPQSFFRKELERLATEGISTRLDST